MRKASTSAREAARGTARRCRPAGSPAASRPESAARSPIAAPRVPPQSLQLVTTGARTVARIWFGQGSIAFGPNIENGARLVKPRWRDRPIPAERQSSNRSAPAACSARSACACARWCRRLFGAGRIHQLDGQPVAIAPRREVVAGRSGLRRDDRAVLAEQGVEQPALADVGRAEQHDARKCVGAVAIAESAVRVPPARRRSVRAASTGPRGPRGSTSGSSVKSRFASR